MKNLVGFYAIFSGYEIKELSGNTGINISKIRYKL